MELALKAVECGYKVTPIRSDKRPYLSTVAYSDDPEQVATWWGEYPDALVGIGLEGSGITIVDVDVHANNGFETIESLKLPVTTNLIYKSLSGKGAHHWYKSVGSDTAIGIYKGIDVKSDQAAGYVIVNYDVPMLEDVVVPLPKEYQHDKGLPKGVAFDGSVQDWMDHYCWLDEVPSPKVKALLDEVTSKPLTGNTLVFKVIMRLVFMALEGEPYVPEALEQVHKHWMNSKHSSGDPQAEWDRALQRVINIYGGGIPELTEEELDAVAERLFEEAVDKEQWNQEVKRAASKRIREKNYQGTNFWNWEDLENETIEWTVDQLLYTDSQNGLVGRSQLGKTHLLVSLLCHMSLGKPWFNNLHVKQQRIIYVAGEGRRGITKRFQDWCEAYGEDWNVVKQNIKIVSDADLSLEVSLDQLKAGANEFKPDLIVLDTLSQSTSMENENDATDMAETLANGRKVYQSASVLWVHHPSEATRFQPDPKPRGSSVFKSNLDNMMTITEDKKFQPEEEIERYTNGKEVRFLTLSTDDEAHGGKSKEGAPITIRGLYLWEYKRGCVVMAQTAGSETHPDNIVIRKVFEAFPSKSISTKDFWAKADELGLKDSEDKEGGWTSVKSAERMLEKAEVRGIVYAERKKNQSTMWTQFDALEWASQVGV